MTSEEKKKLLGEMDAAINAVDRHDVYSVGMRNGIRYAKSLIDGKEQEYEKVSCKGGFYG